MSQKASSPFSAVMEFTAILRFLLWILLILVDPSLAIPDIECDESSANKTCTINNLILLSEQATDYDHHLLRDGVESIVFNNSLLFQLPTDLFFKVNTLMIVHAAGNSIQQLPVAGFTHAKNLKFLNLNNNSISLIGPHAFVGAVSLDELWVSHNQIEAVHPKAFGKVGTLTTLNLDNNRIEKLEPGTFDSLVLLKHLQLDHNRIEYVDDALFEKNVYLEDVNLAFNRITRWTSTMFANQERLNTITIANNQLTEVYVNENVTEIWADNNCIKSVQVANTTVINLLSLRHNNVSDVTTVATLHSLDVLDLGYNRVSHVNLTWFGSLHRLQLYLDGNDLEELTFGKVSYKLPTHQTIPSPLDNRWNCTYLTTMLKNLGDIGVKLHYVGENETQRENTVEGIECKADDDANEGGDGDHNQLADFLLALLEYLRKFSYIVKVILRP